MSAPDQPSPVTAGDPSGTETERNSDKLDDKLAQTDQGLAKVIDAWPALPDGFKASILAIVETATKTQGKTARKKKE